jgi:hypothetical protein
MAPGAMLNGTGADAEAPSARLAINTAENDV